MKILNIPSREVYIYDMIPGYKFKIRYNNDATKDSYQVECEEDVKHNMKFNPNGTFTYDMFVSYIHTTSVVDALRSIAVKDFVLTFIIFNEYVLNGMDISNLPREGLYCVAVENPYKKFDPPLLHQFCKEYNVAELKPIYSGPTPQNPDFINDIMKRSQISTDGMIYGAYIIGIDDGQIQKIKPSDIDFVGIVEEKPNQILEEYVASKASSEFIMENLKKFGVTLTNSTRVYNAIYSGIILDPEFKYCKSQILKYESQDWLDKNIRPVIKSKFRSILQQMKERR
jgi:hypothetical protein